MMLQSMGIKEKIRQFKIKRLPTSMQTACQVAQALSLGTGVA
jgi:hypothetical protein